MSNVLDDQKQQQVLVLGRLGWSLRRIEASTGVRRETASDYLKAAGIPVRDRGGRPRVWPPKPATTPEVSTDPRPKPAISGEVSTDSDRPKPATRGEVSTDSGAIPQPGRAPSASACEPYRELIVDALGRGRNAMAIWQDLVDGHGFPARYASVRRFVAALRGSTPVEARVVIATAPGEEGQVDYGDGPMVRHSTTGKYRRTREKPRVYPRCFSVGHHAHTISAESDGCETSLSTTSTRRSPRTERNEQPSYESDQGQGDWGHRRGTQEESRRTMLSPGDGKRPWHRRVMSTMLDAVARRVEYRLADRLHDHDSARRLVAVADSAEYAARHMQGAIATPDKDVVLFEGLKLASPDGLFAEFGVWGGSTINKIAERVSESTTVHGFDSFEGLPQDWWGPFRKGLFDTKGRLPHVRANVELHQGWFDATVPQFAAKHPETPIAFLHVDCDLYSSTKTIFDCLGKRLGPGSIIVFDEYFNYPGWREHEYKAFQELVTTHSLRYRYVAYNTCEWNAAVQIIE